MIRRGGQEVKRETLSPHITRRGFHGDSIPLTDAVMAGGSGLATIPDADSSEGSRVRRVCMTS